MQIREQKDTILKLLGYGVLFINILVGIWLLLCYAASVLSPARVAYLELFSLSTPLAIIANVIFIFIWLFSKRKWRTLFPLLLLVICYKIIPPVFGFNYLADNDMTRLNSTLKLMLWNVHGMGYFDEAYNHHANEIMDVVRQECPDVLCMPEYYLLKEDSLKPFTARLLHENDFKEYRFCTDNPYDFVNFGIAVFSKYTIKNYKAYPIGKYIYLMQCDMLLPDVKGDKVVRMFFTHLCSFMVSDDDKEMVASVRDKKSFDDADLWKYKKIIGKFNKDYAERATEADNAAYIIRQSPYPVVVCGDMNDLPASYTYTAMRGNLNDAFVQQGTGFGRTYNEIFPTLRIDHIFYDPLAMHVIGYKIPHIRLSDHYPVIANFEIEQKYSD